MEDMKELKDLFDACSLGDTTLVSDILYLKKIEVDSTNNEDVTALQVAAANGNNNVVQLLIMKGASLEKYNIGRWTPLLHAARQGHLSVIQTLLQNKANVNARTRLGTSSLILACRKGDIPSCKALNSADLDPSGHPTCEPCDPGCDFMPLMVASFFGHEPLVRHLLENNKEDVNQCSPSLGISSLMLAALGGHENIIKLLIEKEANPNFTDVNGKTALEFSLARNNKRIQALLSRITTCKPTAVLEELKLDIIEATKKGNFQRVKEILDMDISQRDAFQPEYGATALMFASMSGRLDIVQELIERGCDIDKQDLISGWTALMQAIYHGKKVVAKYLINIGANVHIMAKNNCTAFDMVTLLDDVDTDLYRMLATSTFGEMIDKGMQVSNNAKCQTLNSLGSMHLYSSNRSNSSKSSLKNWLIKMSNRIRHLRIGRSVNIPNYSLTNSSLWEIDDISNDGTDRQVEDGSTKIVRRNPLKILVKIPKTKVLKKAESNRKTSYLKKGSSFSTLNSLGIVKEMESPLSLAAYEGTDLIITRGSSVVYTLGTLDVLAETPLSSSYKSFKSGQLNNSNNSNPIYSNNMPNNPGNINNCNNLIHQNNFNNHQITPHPFFLPPPNFQPFDQVCMPPSGKSNALSSLGSSSPVQKLGSIKSFPPTKAANYKHHHNYQKLKTNHSNLPVISQNEISNSCLINSNNKLTHNKSKVSNKKPHKTPNDKSPHNEACPSSSTESEVLRKDQLMSESAVHKINNNNTTNLTNRFATLDFDDENKHRDLLYESKFIKKDSESNILERSVEKSDFNNKKRHLSLGIFENKTNYDKTTLSSSEYNKRKNTLLSKQNDSFNCLINSENITKNLLHNSEKNFKTKIISKHNSTIIELVVQKATTLSSPRSFTNNNSKETLSMSELFENQLKTKKVEDQDLNLSFSNPSELSSLSSNIFDSSRINKTNLNCNNNLQNERTKQIRYDDKNSVPFLVNQSKNSEKLNSQNLIYFPQNLNYLNYNVEEDCSQGSIITQNNEAMNIKDSIAYDREYLNSDNTRCGMIYYPDKYLDNSCNNFKKFICNYNESLNRMDNNHYGENHKVFDLPKNKLKINHKSSLECQYEIMCNEDNNLENDHQNKYIVNNNLNKLYKFMYTNNKNNQTKFNNTNLEIETDRSFSQNSRVTACKVYSSTSSSTGTLTAGSENKENISYFRNFQDPAPKSEDFLKQIGFPQSYFMHINRDRSNYYKQQNILSLKHNLNCSSSNNNQKSTIKLENLNQKKNSKDNSHLLNQFSTMNNTLVKALTDIGTDALYSNFNDEESFSMTKNKLQATLHGIEKDIGKILQSLSLEKYQAVFEEQEVDLDTFMELTDSNLCELGITQNESRKKLLSVIEQINSSKVP